MKILTCLKPCFTLLLLFFLVPTSGAAESGENTKKKNMASNLHVISDEMISEKSQSMVNFTGNVKVTRDDSILLADSVKVFFHTSETKKEGQSNVREIVAIGNVEYTAGERKAFADKAVYTTQNEILVLTGNSPKLLTGKSHITGKKITLFRLEERVMVESDGKKRVQAFFDAEDQNRPTAKSKE